MTGSLKRAWIAEVPWELVVWQNKNLCKAKVAHHGPTSDGYEETKLLWNTYHRQEFDLLELADFCRRCHRMAPFTNYNGNTFSAIVRTLVEDAGFGGTDLVLARSLAGHIVAGVAGEDEVEAFKLLCGKLG